MPKPRTGLTVMVTKDERAEIRQLADRYYISNKKLFLRLVREELARLKAQDDAAA